MENNMQWSWVYTGRDFLADLLRAELEDNSIHTQLKSQTTSGLMAGFGTSGMARVFVESDKLDSAKGIVEEFEHRQEE